MDKALYVAEDREMRMSAEMGEGGNPIKPFI